MVRLDPASEPAEAPDPGHEGIELSVKVAGFPEVVRFVLASGGHTEVLAPREPPERIAARLDRARAGTKVPTEPGREAGARTVLVSAGALPTCRLSWGRLRSSKMTNLVGVRVSRLGAR